MRTEVVDRFLASVGELMQRQARLEVLHRDAPAWELHREFREELDGMGNVVRELRRRALDIRTTSVRRLLQRLPRTASDLARELGKRVKVELAGEEVEVDRAILDHLDEPLLHLVRNAVDHGIEPPEERERKGKPPVGTIRLSAAQASGRLHVTVEEDGRGIDLEKVRQRAVERGLLAEMVAEDLSPERICELVFEPGISTRDEVTEVSGRGVGMDAVKRTVESLGGSVTLVNRPGAGTLTEIELPAMVALQRVLVLEVGNERVVLPVGQLQSVLSVAEAQVERAGIDAFFVFKDEPLPLLDLSEHIGLGPSPTRASANVLVFETRGFRFGLLIDRAVSDLEVFVREVPGPLAEIKALGGVAILPDGEPVFLLEPGSLVESFV
ncbi:MAG: ATP-binding protein [Myxococcota bacterium]